MQTKENAACRRKIKQHAYEKKDVSRQNKTPPVYKKEKNTGSRQKEVTGRQNQKTTVDKRNIP